MGVCSEVVESEVEDLTMEEQGPEDASAGDDEDEMVLVDGKRLGFRV